MGSGWTDHGLVFCHVDGSLLHPEYLSEAFNRQVGRVLARDRGLQADATVKVAGVILGAGIGDS